MQRSLMYLFLLIFLFLFLLGFGLLGYLILIANNDAYANVFRGLGQFMSGIGTLGLLSIALFKLPKELKKLEDYVAKMLRKE